MNAAKMLGCVACLLLSTGCEVAVPQGKGKPAAPFECRRTIGKMKMDGVLNEISWENAQMIDNFMVSWSNRRPKTATKARLLWDAEYLYFAAEMQDTDLYADVKEPNGKLWENDVFELFFKPSEKKLAYYEFQVNAAGTPLQLFFPSRGAGGYRRFAPETQVTIESVVKLNGTLNDWTDKDKGWLIEGRIPWSAFKATGGRPAAGDKWRFALCRYDYSVEFDRAELSTCAPLTVGDFHRYEDYAELIFLDRPQ